LIVAIEVISTDDAPQAIGPYSQAVMGKGLVFTSGQIAIEAETGHLIQGGVKEQTKMVLENLKAVLEAADCYLENVVKTTVYLTDMNDFAAMNETYAETFGTTRPARTTVEVSRLPKDARVEIDAIAVVGRDTS
jgi:2-iminobutanoate/2-iminopropanoate deaminase